MKLGGGASWMVLIVFHSSGVVLYAPCVDGPR